MTSLFSPDDIVTQSAKQVEDSNAFGIVINNNDVVVSLGKSKEKLIDAIGTLDKTNRMVVSNGSWSMHDMLFYCLEQTGKATVDIITWQISQMTIEMLSKGKSTGLITELNCLLDRRTPIRRQGEMGYIRSLADSIFLIDCHAKITLISNDNWKISIFSSANMTRNKRVEFFILYFDQYIYDFNKNWFTELLNEGHPFDLNEIDN